jgi:hypothetical protein
MNIKPCILGLATAALFLTALPGKAGGRSPLYLTKIHGDVQVRLEKPDSRWKKAKLGSLDGGPYLLRTGSKSYVHLGKFRCVDDDSLIRINRDSEASIDVLRGQMSAVDGKRGKSLPDEMGAP